MKIDVKEIQKAKNIRNFYVPIQVQDFMMQLLQTNMSRTNYFKTCLTCSNFNEQTEVCVLAGIRPPASVIANACPAYADSDDVPF